MIRTEILIVLVLAVAWPGSAAPTPRRDTLRLYTLAWRNETSYRIMEMDIPANGRMPITANEDEQMKIDYRGDPFNSGSSYCTTRVHRLVNGKQDIIVPEYEGTKMVEGILFYMYRFKSVFPTDDIYLTQIHFNTRGRGCEYTDEDHEEDHN